MLFSKKEMNVAAAEKFWQWFAEQEQWIIDNINTNGLDVVLVIDAQIKPVIPNIKN